MHTFRKWDDKIKSRTRCKISQGWEALKVDMAHSVVLIRPDNLEYAAIRRLILCVRRRCDKYRNWLMETSRHSDGGRRETGPDMVLV
jgi:hypothetical protein